MERWRKEGGRASLKCIQPAICGYIRMGAQCMFILCVLAGSSDKNMCNGKKSGHPPLAYTPCRFFANYNFQKIQEETSLRHICTRPCAISKSQGQPKKNGTALCADFCKKRAKSSDSKKNTSVGRPSRTQKRIFLKKSKRGTQGHPMGLLMQKS